MRIDDDLYKRVKARAAREGRTVASVLEDAVRLGMHATSPSSVEPVVLTKISAGGLRPGIDLSSGASVQEALDEGLPVEKLR